MIHLNDNIKIGHRTEKVYDIMDDVAPFSVDDRQADNCYIVNTDLGEIMLTGDTYIMRSDGQYIRVDQLKPYAHSLKHVSGVAAVKGIYPIPEKCMMVSVWDTDYIIVNGFYISPDM